MTNNWGNPVTATINAHHNMRAAVLADWNNAKAELKKAQARENELRNQVIGLFSEKVNDATATGTENCEAPGGVVKIVRKMNYSFTADNDGIDTVLDKIEKSVEGGNIIAERLVKWKPELSLTEYKLLSPAHKKLIDGVLSSKPATPSVEFVPSVA